MYQRCTIGVTLLLNKTRQSAFFIIELQLKKIIKLLIFLVESSLYFNFLNRKNWQRHQKVLQTNFYSYAKNFGEVRKSLIGTNMSHRGTVFSI